MVVPLSGTFPLGLGQETLRVWWLNWGHVDPGAGTHLADRQANQHGPQTLDVCAASEPSVAILQRPGVLPCLGAAQGFPPVFLVAYAGALCGLHPWQLIEVDFHSLRWETQT